MPKLKGWEIYYFRKKMKRELTKEEIRRWVFGVKKMICKYLCAKKDKSVISCSAIFMTKHVFGKECLKKENKYEVNPECWNCD